MELTEKHVEAIKNAARSVDYGSVTIQIAADRPGRLELNVQNRIRLESESTVHTSHRFQKEQHERLLKKSFKTSPDWLNAKTCGKALCDAF